MHRADLDNMSNLLALQNAVPSSSGHTSHIQQLGSVDHVVVYGICGQPKQFPTALHHSTHTFTAGNADSASFHLEAKAALVFPERGCHPRLHSWRRVLPRGVECVVRLHTRRAAHPRQGKDGLRARNADAARDGRRRGRLEAGVPSVLSAVGGIAVGRIVARVQYRGLRMGILAHGAGCDGLWRLRLPSRDVRRVVHLLSTGIHGVVRVDVRQMRVNRYRESINVGRFNRDTRQRFETT